MACRLYRTDFSDPPERGTAMAAWMKDVPGILEHDAHAAAIEQHTAPGA